jgi:hypothetical protein
MTADGPDCPLEHEQQSEHSRGGLVEDAERLGRLIYHDEQVDDATGELKSGAFQMDEFLDGTRRGASVARVDRSNAHELRCLADKFVARGRERWVRGLGVSPALHVRQVSDSANRRVFCVVDDGQLGYEAHALINRSEVYKVGGLTEKQLKAKLKPFRERLRVLFSPLARIEDIYG